MDIKKHIQHNLRDCTSYIADCNQLLAQDSISAVTCIEIAIEKLLKAKKALEVLFDEPLREEEIANLAGGQDE